MVKYFSLMLMVLAYNLVFSQKITREQYIDTYKDISVREMKRVGVPASITLAQGLLESDNGNSSLAVKANNHFGIKCHKSWSGKTYYHDDDKPNECFRKYKSADESFEDHSNFLRDQSRYAFLFDLKSTDYESWARGLKKAGYATNSSYDKMLIKIIEDNQLHRFDDKNFKPNTSGGKELAGDPDGYVVNPFGSEILSYNRIDYILALEGDTFESIADRYNIRAWQLYKYNELPSTATIRKGQRLYLQPKRRKAAVGNKFHTVAPGENIYVISQKYGIKLKFLFKMNNLTWGSEPDIGYTLSLRKNKSKL